MGDIMRLSELQHKDIVDLNGRRIGNIIDVKLDRDGKLISLVIESSRKFLKFKQTEGESEISWDKIERIGDDVILVRI